MTEEAKTSTKEILRRIALVIGFPFFFLAATEYVLWVFDVEPPPDEAATDETPAKVGGGVSDPEALDARFQRSERPRLVCFGGSTVAGAPFEGRMNMCTAMAEALPGYELVNLAGSGQDSHDVLAHAKIVCKHPNALLFVYSGHNEFLNLERYAGQAPPAPVAAAARFFSRFRFYRLIQRMVASDEPKAPRELGEATLSDAQVYARYAANMTELLQACRDQPLVLATVIANPDLGFAMPGSTIRASLRRHGRASPVPLSQECKHCFRAGPTINSTIRHLAARFEVPLVETEPLLSTGAGFELFWDHCHPKPDVHVAIAGRVLAAAQAKGWVKSPGTPRHRLTADELRRTELERAVYNIQFDPHWALARLEALRNPEDPLALGLGIAIAGFLIDDRARIDRGFAMATSALKNPNRREGAERCLREGGGGGRGLSCMRWPSRFLMDEPERAELVAHARRAGDPLVIRLMEAF